MNNYFKLLFLLGVWSTVFIYLGITNNVRAVCTGAAQCCTERLLWQCPNGSTCLQNQICSSTTTKTCSTGGSCSVGCNQPCRNATGHTGVCRCSTNNVMCAQRVVQDCQWQSCFIFGTGALYPEGTCNNTSFSCTGSSGQQVSVQCSWANSCTWGAWSACSLPCGGGTQTRTNSCSSVNPNPETQACNTQSCGGGCTPSCSPQCGQNNGCGGTCSNSDGGAPGAPGSTTPVNGGAVTPVGNQITVSWTAGARADLYEVQVYPTGTPAGQECTAPNTHCRGANASLSYSFTNTGGITDYTWRIRPTNNTCGTILGSWTTQTFTVGGSITGTFYIDNSRQASLNPGTGLCQLGGASSTSPAGGSTVQAVWNGNTTPGVIAGSNFTITNVGSDPNTVVSFNNSDSNYSCTCPAGCSYSGLQATVNNVNFYITNQQVGWWQTRNGNMYAGDANNEVARSLIPNTCVAPGCIPAISRRDANSTANSSGLVLTGGGTVDSTADSTTQYPYLSEDARTERVTGNKLNGPRETYGYFTQLYSLGSTPSVDFNGTKPGAAPTNGRAYYGSGDVNINSAWSVASGEKLVIFINGNLTINNTIDVTPGGFVAFIVSGNITVGNTVGQALPSSTVGVVEGVYIADGQIIIQGGRAGGDLKFVGEGTFVGWGGVQMQRAYVSAATNNTAPTELFTFRPDLVVNIPERMTKPIYLWQETN